MTNDDGGREMTESEVDTSGQGAGEWVSGRADDLERMARDAEAQVTRRQTDEATNKVDDLAQERLDDTQRKIDEGATEGP